MARPCGFPNKPWTAFSKEFTLTKTPAPADDDRKFRQQKLLDTLERLQNQKVQGITETAQQQLATKRCMDLSSKDAPAKVEVIEGDWGTITEKMTSKYCEIYTVLNMANSTKPGGGYESGEAAQEENMFYRSSCHFFIDRIKEIDPRAPTKYTETMTKLIEAVDDEVYLDVQCPRVCIKGEEKQEPAAGATTQINRTESYKDITPFPFYEMRAAADDRNQRNADGKRIKGAPLKDFDVASMTKKIKAQFSTLKKNGRRRVILSAFGCGAFKNPPEEVARIYKKEIERVKDNFDHIVFAIYPLGGDDNYSKFMKVLKDLPYVRCENKEGGQDWPTTTLPPPPTTASTAAPAVTNCFNKDKRVEVEFYTLTYNNTLTDINVTEAPFFPLLAQNSIDKIDTLLNDPPIASGATFPLVTGTFAMIDNPRAPLLEELAFLEHQCLAFKRGTAYYISNYAQLFYGPAGLFALYTPPSRRAPSPRQTTAYVAKMSELATLFLTYVLPGQFWRRYYVTYPLPSKIAARQVLDKELSEIEMEWKNLYDKSV